MARSVQFQLIRDYRAIREKAGLSADDHRLTHARMERLLKAYSIHRPADKVQPAYTPHDFGTRLVNAHLVQAIGTQLDAIPKSHARIVRKLLGTGGFTPTPREKRNMTEAFDALVDLHEDGRHLVLALMNQVEKLKNEHRKFYDAFHPEQLSVPEESVQTPTFLKNQIDRLLSARRPEFIRLLHACEDATEKRLHREGKD